MSLRARDLILTPYQQSKMMEEKLGPFPTVDEVLDKLKSNGTFDQFRKACLASVEAEPSFRAYGEHIEVVSRRYLQNYKWNVSTTKNKLRSRLKSHALSVIASPDIQVGVPFSSLVEKAMESKGKELLPKIQEVITSLRQAQPPSTTTSDKTKPRNGEDRVPSKSAVEFDLTLPIDLPGLGLSSYPSVPAKKQGTSGNDGKGSRKSKQVESGTKEVKGGGPRVKSQASDGKMDTSAVKDGKKEEGKEEAARRAKKSAEPIKGKEEGKEEEPFTTDEVGVKDNKRISKIRRGKEEVKDKAKEKILQEKAKVLDEEPGNEGRNKRGGSANSKESSNLGDDKNGDQEVKQQPVRRRSARIASLTDEPKKNDASDVESDTFEESHSKRPSPSADVQLTKSGRKKTKPRVSSRKRTRAWADSNSEDQESEEEMEKRPRCSKTPGSKASSVESTTRKREHDSDREMDGPFKRLRHSKSPSLTAEKHEPASTNKRKSRQPRRVSRASKSPLKSPSPIVTRFNRQVKPNRKYCDSSEEQEGSEEEEEGTEQES